MFLKLVKEVIEAKDAKSFFFAPSEKFTWQPGQYAYITLGKITKQFTIANSPTEEFIQITTRIRKESEFKQNLDSLEIGSEIESRAPFGAFIIDKNITNNIFLAGGIGITPFRSMIKYNIDNKLGIKMTLIYSNSDSDHVFKRELDKWQKENDFIKIEYIDTSLVGRIDKLKILEFIGNCKLEIKNCMFWSVGPNTFANAMEDILDEMKIPQDRVKTEKFIGY